MIEFLKKIHCGDAVNILKKIPSNSIDCVTTDPPYGYSFMGKDWDKAVPSVEVWRECLRVLKYGAFMFVMSSPRQDVLSQMIVRLGQAGFDTGFTSIYWTYASGFPKAMNISKAVDKRLGFEQENIGVNPSSRPNSKLKSAGGFDGLKGEGSAGTQFLTKPVSVEAKLLDGSYGGFQPKPAVEIIIVCMKPLSEKTYVDQALANKKGVTWLDNARIPYESQTDKEQATPQGKCTSKEISVGAEPDAGRNLERVDFERPDLKGRFPANLICSDDVLNDGKITQGIHSKRGGNVSSGEGRYQWNAKEKENFDKDSAYECGYDDSGSFSRYFDLDIWFEKQIEGLPEEIRKTFPFLICPKASKSERNKGVENFDIPEYRWNNAGTCKQIKGQKGNFHPTVKPLKLMSYLVTLGSRKGDIILDPFLGSGTTALAAEILERNWIGIELNQEYCEIAKARLNGAEILYHKGETINTTTTTGTCKSKNCTFKDEKGNCSGNGLKLKCKDRE